MDIKEIMIVFLLLSASALCIYLIFFLKSLSKSIQQINSDIHELTYEIKPLIESTTNLSEKLTYLSREAQEPIDMVRNIVYEIKYRIDKLLDLEQKFREGIEKPVTDAQKNVSAVLNGFNAFWKSYKNQI